MKENIIQYLQKHYPFDKLFGEPKVEDPNIHFNQYKVSRIKRTAMHVLRISPYICGALFVVSFLLPLLASPSVAQLAQQTWMESLINGFSDFHRQNERVFQAVLTISVSGLIGYGTNYIAIRMLFRPVRPRPIWGQGLIPAQRDRIIFTLAKGMHKHILNQDLIRKRIEESRLINQLNDILIDGTISLIQDLELREVLKELVLEGMMEYAERDHFRAEIRHAIDARLEAKIESGVKKLLFQTYKRYNKAEYEDAIDNIVKDIPKITMEVLEKLEEELNRLSAYFRLQKRPTEDYIMQVIVDLLNRIDITGLLAKQMEHFDEARLEKMVWEATNEQLLYIQYLGTILGLLGGFLIWQPILMGGIYVAFFGGLYVLDNLLFRMKKQASAK